ncbi:MAG: alpha/beta hydrolase family protein [Syntrophobacter sp.]
MATYVFVHGAFQGGWVWKKVESILRDNRHEVYSPTLTGCGERSHLLREDVDLHTYISDIGNFFYFENVRDVILVSNGYSGMVTSAVLQAMPQVARKILYIDAVIPRQGKSFLDLAGEGLSHVIDSHLRNNWLVKPWALLSFGITEPADREWFEPRLVNFPLAAFTTQFPGKFDGTLFDRTFVHCRNGPDGANWKTGHEAKRMGWDYCELESGPFPMVTAPQELAALLMSKGD